MAHNQQDRLFQSVSELGILMRTAHSLYLSSYSTVQRFVYLVRGSATTLIARFVTLTKLNKKITFVGAVGARGKSNKS